MVLKQLAKYVATTLLGTTVDTLVLWLLSTYAFDGSHVGRYVISPIISFECAVIVNFTTAYNIVWKDRVDKAVRHRKLKKFWKYNLSCISAFMLKMLILNVLGLTLKWPPFLCNLIALCFSGILNFVINEFYIFKKKEDPIQQNRLPDPDKLMTEEEEKLTER